MEPVTLHTDRLTLRSPSQQMSTRSQRRALGFRYEGLMRQLLASPRGRDDAWVGGLLPADGRTPANWPVLTD